MTEKLFKDCICLCLFQTQVFFSALKTSQSVLPDSVVTFNMCNANMREGMDARTGEFTTPVTGIYSFTFTGFMDDVSNDALEVFVLKNSAEQQKIFNTGSLMLQLMQGDVISLKTTAESSGTWSMSFTGQSLKLDG